MSDHLLQLLRRQRRRARIDEDRTGFIVFEKLGESERGGERVVEFRLVEADQRYLGDASLGFVKRDRGFQRPADDLRLGKHLRIARNGLRNINPMGRNRPARRRDLHARRAGPAPRLVRNALFPEGRAIARPCRSRPQAHQQNDENPHRLVSPLAAGKSVAGSKSGFAATGQKEKRRPEGRSIILRTAKT